MLGQIILAENHRLGLPDFKPQAWDNFACFLNRSWLNRVWIIQEAALSRISPLILCGDVVFLWDRFSDTIDWLDRQGDGTATEFSSYALTSFFIHSTR